MYGKKTDMNREQPDENHFLALRSNVDTALYNRREEPPDHIIFPTEEGADLFVKTITTAELLVITLSAVAKATRRLRESQIAIDMGAKPLEMKFTGTVAGFSKKDGEIYLKLKN